MNIQYEKIIETANKRKETLQQLAALLEATPAMLKKATELHDWMKLVSLTTTQLDKEGMALLPEKVRKQLLNWPVNYMSYAVGSSIDGTGMSALVAALVEAR